MSDYGGRLFSRLFLLKPMGQYIRQIESDQADGAYSTDQDGIPNFDVGPTHSSDPRLERRGRRFCRKKDELNDLAHRSIEGLA